MQGNRSRDTKPELAVRTLLHGIGLRYRVDVRPERAIRRRADVVFTRARVAVFIDGCFWHGCPDHFRYPVEHADYWRDKIGRNRERDAETDALLDAAGWRVLRFWSHESPVVAVQDIAAQVIRDDEELVAKLVRLAAIAPQPRVGRTLRAQAGAASSALTATAEQSKA